VSEVPPLKMIDPTPQVKAPRPGGHEERLVSLGLVLPEAAAPVAAYVPAVEAGGLLYVSGQLPFKDGQVLVGRAGEDRTMDFAQAAARACGLMILSQARAALGSLDRIERVVKINVFVNSDPRFTDQPKVANGTSDLMVDLFGDAGRHARAAVGVAALPLGAVVEADAVFAISPV
jgi:enamine deaminase RidA (YjgF/YER057c/UK114 family)